jgi:ribosomal protein S18 acetylase RimI-like enzyme
MERRTVDLRTDYATLAAMQRTSWDINFPGEPYVEGAFRHSLERAVSSDDVMVYLEGQELVGWLWLDWRVGRERAHIRHLQVAQAFWGRGYGGYLVREAFRMARNKGRSEITLNVTKSNERAMRLYAGHGFVVKHDLGERLHMHRDLAADGQGESQIVER